MTSTQVRPSSTPQVAINDIGSAEDFLAAIDLTIKYFNDGDIVEGVIVKVDRDEVLLDIGYKTEGVIPSRELSIKHDVDPNEVVKVGDEVEALVLQKEDKEGRLILSKKRAQYERAWGTIEAKKEADEVVTGTVIEVVKGGLILDIGLRGFLPASLVEMRRVRDLQPYVGRELEAKIIELDKNRNNVVLSRRQWLEQTQSEVRSEFLNKLAKGQVRTGVVSSIVNFGAFVDLGGVDGLVHVSELSWKHIDHPSEVVEVGQEVTVEVLDVDLDRERVSLSLKATQEDPWRQFARTHQIGQVVPGQGHQARSLRCVRARRRGHRGPGAHLRAGRAPRGDPGAGRAGRRRDPGQGHRHRPGPPPHLAVAQAGQRGRRRRRGAVRPGRLRHGRVLRRARATTSTPRASTPTPASGARASTTQREEWEKAVRRGPGPLRGAPQADRGGQGGRRRGRGRWQLLQRRRCRPGAPPAERGGTLASDEALAALRAKLAGGE